MAFGNPIDAFLQVGEAKNRNRQQALENIASIGQGLGQGFNTIGQAIQEAKKKQILNQLVQAMQQKGQPIPGPQGYVPPNQGPASTAVPAGQPAPGNNQLLQSLMMQYDPQSAMRMMPTPLQQSEIEKNNALAKRYQQMSPKPTPQGPGSPLTPQQELRKAMIDAINKRTAVQEKGLNNRQINTLTKSTGIQSGLLKQIQTNNVRADRALDVLSGTVYPQKFNLALTDLAGIMTGGVPQLVELHHTQFPTWQEDVARWKLYATGNPNTPVPPEAVNAVRELVKGLKDVDNQYLRQNTSYQTQMLGPTIPGFEKIAPVVNRASEEFIKGGVKDKKQEDPLGIR